MTEAASLPDDLLDWIADVTGGVVVAALRVPGGASREAWFVDIERADGAAIPLFLRYSRERPGRDSAFHDLRTEAAIFRALHGTGVTVPRTIGVHPTYEAMLAERVDGETWFYRIEDPNEQVLVAQDFIRNLAALHRLDPATLDLPGLLPVTTARLHALGEIDRMRVRVSARGGTVDPLVRISLGWLERKVPDYEAPVVLVQGDTGPGNFMYRDGRVTAVVDWELAHLGDPMDDIAWLSLRAVQDTFTQLPDRLREYERLSGHTVDVERVWYYRLFAETRLMCEQQQAASDPAGWDGENSDGEARLVEDVRAVEEDIGNRIIYGVLHRRLTLEALAHVMGIELPRDSPVRATDEPARTAWSGGYDSTLGALQSIVPRIDDPLARQWAKGVARMVKYLKELDRYGRLFESFELEDIARLLGDVPARLGVARRQLADAANAGAVGDKDYVLYAWRRVQRDDFVLRTASGALYERSWPPLG
jgi:aminoglycoside phosphotransferase (APT) family kinase protein